MSDERTNLYYHNLWTAKAQLENTADALEYQAKLLRERAALIYKIVDPPARATPIQDEQ